MYSPMSFDNYTDLPVNSAGLVVTPLGDIPLPYFLQVVTVVFIFTLSVFSGSSLWMMFDLWSMFMYGLIQLLFPFIFIPQVEVRVDGVHLFMVRAFGIMLLGSAYLWWKVRNSKDITVHTTLMWARVMGGAAALLAQAFAQFNKASRMTQEHLYLSVLLTVLWTLGNLIYCIRSTEWGGYMETRSKLNNFLHTDFVITLIFGIMFYAYPVWLLRVQTSLPRLNVVHAHLYRLFGSALMSSAIISGRASNFLIASDKRIQLYTRVLINVGLIILFLVTYFTAKHNDWSVPNTPFILGVVGIWTLNAFCGSYSLAYFKS